MQLVCSWGASVGQLYPNNLKMVALLNLLNFILLFLYIASCGMFTTQIWLQRIFNEHNPAKSKVICLRNLAPPKSKHMMISNPPTKIHYLSCSFIDDWNSFSTHHAWIIAADIGQCLEKINLCPTKAASQRTQLSSLKLKNFL